MDIASCKIAATELLIKEIVPNMRLVPIFRIMATPITIRKSTGSAQEFVVKHKMIKIMMTAITVIIAICTFNVSSRDLFSTAGPP